MLDVLQERESTTAGGGYQFDGRRYADPISANTALWRSLPARAASVRHLSLAAEAADNDVIDPYRRSADYYRQMEDELAPAIISVLRFARLNAPAHSAQ
jgi:protein-tyrosine phosphatase